MSPPSQHTQSQKSDYKLHSFRTLLLDPLAHFLLIGLMAYGLMQQLREPAADNTMIVTAEFIEQLERDFHHSFLRPPTTAEKQQLVENAVMDLALYREGLAYHLDAADAVVKRRVIQKMNFILEGWANPGTPTPEMLADYLEAHADQFTTLSQYSFEHRYISGHAPDSEARARQLTAAQGETFLRGHTFSLMTEPEIDQLFGRSFGKALTSAYVNADAAQAENRWLGPIASTYGWHLVRVSAVTPAQTPTLKDVQSQVYAAWKQSTLQANVQQLKQQLLSKYQVQITPAATESSHYALSE